VLAEITLRTSNLVPGAAIKLKPANEAIPPGVVTATAPAAPAPTTAVMLVALTTVNEAAATPPNVTEVAPVKFVPVMVTVVQHFQLLE